MCMCVFMHMSVHVCESTKCVLSLSVELGTRKPHVFPFDPPTQMAEQTI